MQPGIVLSLKDIKEILAEVFKVPEENVVQTKYSFMLIGADMDIIKKYISGEEEANA